MGSHRKLKYQENINKLSLTVSCPCKEAVEREIIAYRFCYNDLEMPNTFIPQAIKAIVEKKPLRNFSNQEAHCNYYGLSFYVSEHHARNSFNGLPEKIKQNLGYTQLAQGSLLTDDGLQTPTSNSGHFDLHEYEKVSLKERFIIICPL